LEFSFFIGNLEDELSEDINKYLLVKVKDQGLRLERKEVETILKPLDNLGEKYMDKFNLSSIRSISKAINAKLFVQ
jgi:uncharacterized protein with ATP-grasp and redox domains